MQASGSEKFSNIWSGVNDGQKPDGSPDLEVSEVLWENSTGGATGWSWKSGLEWKIPIGILIGIISLWTSIGNAFVVYAIRKTRRLRTVRNALFFLFKNDILQELSISFNHCSLAMLDLVFECLMIVGRLN